MKNSHGQNSITFTSAKEFLEALSPIGDEFGPNHLRSPRSPDWIFRGQADANWHLIPSAFREDIDFPGFNDRGSMSDLKKQIRMEADALLKFLSIADSQGLPLPEDSQHLRNWLYEWTENAANLKRDVNWPPTAVLSLMGLAQHHGIPTRLLDWTYNPYIAAYFAAKEHISNTPKSPEYFAVWAASCCGFKRYDASHRNENAGSDGLYLVSAPAVSNMNLHAQKALFTHLRDRVGHDQKFDKYLEKDNRPIKKCIMPHSQAIELLKSLRVMGYSAKTLLPGFSGIANAIKEESDLYSQ